MKYDHMLDTILSGEVPCTGFGHSDHLGTAHAALRRWEFFEAAHQYANGLRNAAAAAGVPEKFNATMTLAFLCLVAERMDGEDSETFVAENPDLTRDALGRVGYDTARLNHPKSRKIALLPTSA